MRRRWVVAVILAITVSGCSYGTPVEKLSAACPLLATPDAMMFLGDDVVGVEQVTGAGTPVLNCNYRRGDEVVVSVNVQEIPSRGRTPAALVNSLGSRVRGQATSIGGLGEAAVYYEVQRRRVAVLAAAKRSGSSIRVITLSAPQPFSPNRLGALAAIALQHL